MTAGPVFKDAPVYFARRGAKLSRNLVARLEHAPPQLTRTPDFEWVCGRMSGETGR